MGSPGAHFGSKLGSTKGLSGVKEIEKKFQTASVGLEPVNTRLPLCQSRSLTITLSCLYAPVEKIIQSDLSDSSTKLSMFIWAMFGVLVSRFV